jgi:hypothetical protein
VRDLSLCYYTLKPVEQLSYIPVTNYDSTDCKTSSCSVNTWGTGTRKSQKAVKEDGKVNKEMDRKSRSKKGKVFLCPHHESTQRE